MIKKKDELIPTELPNEERITRLENVLNAQIIFTKQIVHFLGILVQPEGDQVHFGIAMPTKGERHRVLSQIMSDIDELKGKGNRIIMPGR